MSNQRVLILEASYSFNKQSGIYGPFIPDDILFSHYYANDYKVTYFLVFLNALIYTSCTAVGKPSITRFLRTSSIYISPKFVPESTLFPSPASKMDSHKLEVAILCGGQSSRMGQPKHDLSLSPTTGRSYLMLSREPGLPDLGCQRCTSPSALRIKASKPL